MLQRFLPSDFGVEEDRVNPLPPFQAFLDKKRKIRREIEASKIPYTYISANCFGAYFVNYLLRPYDKNNHTIVYGNGHAKGTHFIYLFIYLLILFDNFHFIFFSTHNDDEENYM